MSDTDRQHPFENEDVAAALGTDRLEGNGEATAVFPNPAPPEGAFSLEAMPSEADWREIAARLYERNCYLLEKVKQLKEAFSEVTKELDIQTVRARHAEDVLARREADLEAANEERLRLLEELQTVRDAARQDRALVESLGEHLAASQTRVAQMERECASIQQQCQEYAASAAEAEKQSADMYVRLQQQREHTWQFKTALNQYLQEANGDRSEASGDRAPEPIAPWSSALETEPETESALELPEESAVEAPEELVSLTRFGLDLPAVSFKIEVNPEAAESDELLPVEPEPESVADVPEANAGDRSDEGSSATQNYPSPVVYPQRTRKKRDSLAAIELPRFFQ